MVLLVLLSLLLLLLVHCCWLGACNTTNSHVAPAACLHLSTEQRRQLPASYTHPPHPLPACICCVPTPSSSPLCGFTPHVPGLVQAIKELCDKCRFPQPHYEELAVPGSTGTRVAVTIPQARLQRRAGRIGGRQPHAALSPARS